MNRKTLASLVVLNLALFVGLLVTSGHTPAQAQLRSQNSYMMVAGEITGRGEQVVYITELNSSKVLAVIVNTANKQITPLAAWNVGDDLKRLLGDGVRP